MACLGMPHASDRLQCVVLCLASWTWDIDRYDACQIEGLMHVSYTSRLFNVWAATFASLRRCHFVFDLQVQLRDPPSGVDIRQST